MTDFDDRVRESANAAVDNERGLPRRGRDRRGSEGISYQTREGSTGQRNAPANDHADAFDPDQDPDDAAQLLREEAESIQRLIDDAVALQRQIYEHLRRLQQRQLTATPQPSAAATRRGVGAK